METPHMSLPAETVVLQTVTDSPELMAMLAEFRQCLKRHGSDLYDAYVPNTVVRAISNALGFHGGNQTFGWCLSICRRLDRHNRPGGGVRDAERPPASPPAHGAATNPEKSPLASPAANGPAGPAKAPLAPLDAAAAPPAGKRGFEPHFRDAPGGPTGAAAETFRVCRRLGIDPFAGMDGDLRRRLARTLGKAEASIYPRMTTLRAALTKEGFGTGDFPARRVPEEPTPERRPEPEPEPTPTPPPAAPKALPPPAPVERKEPEPEPQALAAVVPPEPEPLRIISPASERLSARELGYDLWVAAKGVPDLNRRADLLLRVADLLGL